MATSTPPGQPPTQRKRRRLDSIKSAQVRRYDLDGKYNDAYRELFNQHVDRAAARFQVDDDWHPLVKQMGSSTWSAKEQSTFFAALQRLGRADIPGIAEAITTKSIPEVQHYFLLLQQAAIKRPNTKLSLRDIPAAIDIGRECDEQLDAAAEVLAWYQELFEANEEQEKFGHLWLITPTIADAIEYAVTGRTRRVSTPPVNDQELPPSRGQRITGSCTSCRQLKQKCNREIPCSNCIRRNIPACLYPEKVVKPAPPDSPDRSMPEDAPPDPHLLEAIPEAGLLQPDVMLILSKNLFMNRCPDFPSPWLHWSKYTTELATEPAIYRSALNDFHTLVISITRRLTQTAIMQATSRLRSQRRCLKRNALPSVKRRDVLAAIDLVGMKRNGKERWREVARRCGLRVFQGREDYAHSSKYQIDLSWEQVEHLLAFKETTADLISSDVETSENDAASFRLRASRKGTPLPMENLTLSDSDGQSEYSKMSSETEMDEELQSPSSRPDSQTGDNSRRSTSLDHANAIDEPGNLPQTLEQFDQQARAHEEKVLWEMLDLEPTSDGDTARIAQETEEDSGIDENVGKETSDWRDWVEYKSQWEAFRKPVPNKLFSATGKTKDAAFTAPVTFPFGDHFTDRDSSADEGARLNPRKELRAEGTRAYAKLREMASVSYNYDGSSSISDSDNSDSIADIPMRSIEDVAEGTSAIDLDDELREGEEREERGENTEEWDEEMADQDEMDLDV